jgi:hypothetical protein
VLGSDIVNLNNPTTGTYDNPNVGTGKNITVTGLAISGASAGNYQLAATSINGNIGVITPAVLTVSNVTANSKVFDATTAATLNLVNATLSGILDSDVVGVKSTGYIANFATKLIGNNIPVIVSNLGLIGAAAKNYILTQPTGLTANITAAATPIVPVRPGAVTPTLFAKPTGPNKSISIENNIEIQGNPTATILPSLGAAPTPGMATKNLTGGVILNEAPQHVYTYTPKEVALGKMRHYGDMLLAILVTIIILLHLRKEAMDALSSDVRLSLNNIIRLSTSLYNEKFGPINDEQRKYLEEIISDTTYISNEITKLEKMSEPYQNVAAHLQTALTDIIGYTYLIRHLKTPTNQKQKNTLKQLRKDSNEILSLIKR